MRTALRSRAERARGLIRSSASLGATGLATARNLGVAYSDRNSADIRPMGTATTMAMPEISRVPANSGTEPNAPEEPT